jgi:F-type H+-transporting ATPase subunit delta
VAGNELGRAYASALLEIGQERGILPQIEEEVGFLFNAVAGDRDLMLFLNAPGVPKESKKNLIDKVFKAELSEIIVNFLKVLIDNNRQNSIRDVHQSLIELIDILNNRQRVEIVTSAKLDEGMLKKLKSALEARFKKEIIIREVIDENIIGGIVIKVGDLIIDGSLAKDLRNIKETLLNSKVRSEAAYED